MKTLCLSFIACGCLAAQLVNAAIVLTEVDFATNTIELTNIGDTNATGTKMDWCVPFSYGALESGGFNFEPGETRTYVIAFNLQSTVGNDLWIYQDNAGFNDESEVITGVVWGSNQAGQGRVNQVVNESPGPAWASTTDFVPTGSVGAGQTMQLAPGSPPSNVSTSWIIADANLGSYAATADLTLSIKAGPGANQVTLFWPTSTPETASLESNGLLATNGWTAVTNSPTTNGANREVLLETGDIEFFRLSN